MHTEPIVMPFDSFATLPDLVRLHARDTGAHVALIHGEVRLDYRALDARIDRMAAGLQRDGIARGDVVAIVAATSIDHVAMFLAILRAGGTVAPIAASSSPDALAAVIADSGAKLVFVDKATGDRFADALSGATVIALGEDAPIGTPLSAWLPEEDAEPTPVPLAPDDIFNIIYSSGTTGSPKGIVQDHGMRWQHVLRGRMAGYTAEAIAIISTPLCSNTTLVSVVPTLANGGTLVLMEKFDARRFLELAERHRVTHAMLVPVQYRRLMNDPEFDRFDLSAFRMKTCTSAPFAADLKAEILRRWPGGLIEIYGMTEGGGTATLAAHLHPHKLDTVGVPVEGHVMRVIDEDGQPLPPGSVGEIVGHSPLMMRHYHNRPAQTRDAEWFDEQGRRYIRTGDIGRFDEDGFLTLLDRRKDVVISGGFNVYPSDIEVAMREHPAVEDVAVVGMPSSEWGETPVAFIVRRARDETPAAEIRNWLNQRVGKTQRISDIIEIDALPRSEIGKVLKRELRDMALDSDGHRRRD
ncbi:class I adenylate-forming enzyme family protein [Sphingomonas colocasiae]|uniref:Acyl--CoA ligase n=1 Tax=Sphingomonas colocasiae TaxID=1848973 RepID=A0ABS7PMB3_9SPHN|nr:class I adenylate-forming enzyme family protein [Sphingomonas colocasiae]MBY8822455.1 acyl--CoA ligase [Sphingomonas colocasiae]